MTRVHPSRLLPLASLALLTGLSGAAATTALTIDDLSGDPATGAASPVQSDTPAPERAFHDPTDADAQAIRELLERREQAVVDQDRSAFLSTIDPRQPTLRRKQGTLFDNLLQVAPTSMAYQLNGKYGIPTDLPGDAPVVRPFLWELVEIPDTVDGRVRNELHMTFVRRGQIWYVGGEQNNDAQERPWFGDRIVAQRSGSITALVDVRSRDSLGELAASVRADIGFVADVLDLAPDYRVLVDATSNGKAASISRFTKEKAAAVSFPLLGETRKGRPGRVGAVIKINPRRIDEAIDQDGLMRHELTHFMLDEFIGTVPTWLGEGIAEYVGHHPYDLSRYVVPDAFWDQLQAAADEVPDTLRWDDDIDLNYMLGWAATTWLVQRAGIDDALDLMAAYDKAYTDRRSIDGLTPKLLRRIYDIRQPDLVAGMAATAATLHH